MSAEEYLQQIIFLDERIKDNTEKVERLKEAAENRTSNLTPDKVQTSARKDKLGDVVTSYAVLEDRIKEDERKRNEILSTLEQLKPYESTILYRFHVSNMFLGEIADSMNRSYSWVAKIHRQGLRRLQAILDGRKD